MKAVNCSKLGCLQRYVPASPSAQPPIKADQITLGSNDLFLGLDKEERK